MTPEYAIRMLAGTLVLTGLILGWLAHPAGYVMTGLVGLNLLQSSVTRWCPAEILLRQYIFTDESTEINR